MRLTQLRRKNMRTSIVVLTVIALGFSSSFLLPQAQDELGELGVLFARAADERPAEFISSLLTVLKANLTGPQIATIRDELAVELGINLALANDPHAGELERIEKGMINLGIVNYDILVNYIQINAEWPEQPEE